MAARGAEVLIDNGADNRCRIGAWPAVMLLETARGEVETVGLCSAGDVEIYNA
jgi:hypothetical protein